MIQRIASAFLLTVAVTICYSQTVEQQKLLVRFNFLGLVDFLDNNLTTGFEYQLNQQWSAGTDVGWIFNSKCISTVKAANGVLLRPFVRYYPKGNSRFFIEGELHYKYVNYKIEDWLGKQAFNGVPAYEEFTEFNFIKKVIGMHVKVGDQMNLTRNKRLKLEFTAGLGLRYKKEYAKEGYYIKPGRFFQSMPRSENIRYNTTAALPFNLRLCYGIK